MLRLASAGTTTSDAQAWLFGAILIVGVYGLYCYS